MLSIATGHGVGYLTGPVARGRENYYTAAVDAGEPAGLWYGSGAAALGLSGTVDADLMEAVYTHMLDPRDPATHSRSTWGEADALAAGHRKYRCADDIYKGLVEAHPDATPEQRAQLRAQAERSARQAVAFIDVTFSAPKSVTVLGVAFERAANDARAAGDTESAQAWAAHAKAVEDAMLAGARAALDFLQDEAGYSRVGHHGGGAGRWVDAHDFVVAQFLQHDSRDRDPQWHVHNAILNRVRCADGTWRALDSRAIHNLRGAASAIAERVMEAHITRTLGVRFETRPDGRAREVVGVDRAVMDLFSSRRRAITARTRELVDAYTARFGHEPNALQRTRLAQEATLATRAGKSHDGETRAEQLDRWAAQLQDEVGMSLGGLAHQVLALRQQVDPAAEWSARDVVERALERAAEHGAHWSRSDLIRAVSDELPAHLGIDPGWVRELLTGVAGDALEQAVRHQDPTDTSEFPAELRLADGSSVFERPGSARYSTAGQFRAEALLRAAGVERGAAAFTAEQADEVLARFAAAGVVLGVDQAAAVRGVLTSGARVEVLTAAAGTGKSFTVGALADTWSQVGERRVFGLAPSEVAAGVLREEGLAAANTTAWLAAQRRLDAAPAGARDGFGDERWRLRTDDLVVVDEAGMTSTTDLADIHARCARAGAKLLVVGDPRQLAAIGPGGALADLAERAKRYDLTEVRRFTAGWEGPASLRLREGDTEVLGEYAKRGRLLDGGTAEQAEASAARAWLADTVSGRESLLLVGTNDAAARLSNQLRAELVALGRVQETGVALGMPGWEGTVAGVGDLVQARRNAHHLVGFDGNTAMPVNRRTYRVTALRPDGGLTVAPVLGAGQDEGHEQLGNPIALPASYVAEHVTLGYASTVHSAQGRTVDTAHAVVGAGLDAAGTYVALTRGRDRNTAYAVTRRMAADAETGQTLGTAERTARAVLHEVLDNARTEQTATAAREQADLDARSTTTHVDQLIDGVAQVTAGRTAAALDRLAADGVLSPDQRAAVATDEAFGSLERLMRTAELAGHDPDAVLAAAAEHRGLDNVASVAQVLHHRVTAALSGRLTPQISSVHDLIPADVPDTWRGWLHSHADAADTRRHEIGAALAEAPPAWAVAALGPPPDQAEDVVARQEWEHRAGWAGAWRELTGRTEDPTAHAADEEAAAADVAAPLGTAPGVGMTEKRALFRAAHEALRLLDAGEEEASMTDGRLRMRVVAYEREQVWAPHAVEDQLAATHQRAEKARTDAAVWTARADTLTDPDEAARLRANAAAAATEAAELAERAALLEQADADRAAWYAATAVTRDNAERARAELRARGVDLDHPDDRVTALEWLDLHNAAETDEDAHREIHDDHELDHHLDDHGVDLDQPTDPDVGQHAAPDDHDTVENDVIVETAVPDIREVSTLDPTEKADPVHRDHVPDVDETNASVQRAQEALAEVQARAAADARRAAAEEVIRQEELARWSTDDTADYDAEPVYER
jgi:conjugative relaxase-like TrwC/TraI family protein